MNISSEEQIYLSTVLKSIEDRVNQLGSDAERVSQDIVSQKKYLWQNLARQDFFEIMTSEQSINSAVNKGERFVEEKSRLLRAKNRPYFARVDFNYDVFEEGEEPCLPVYIGISTIHSCDPNETQKILVFDWRAPIASLFYEFDTGRAYYQAPIGKIYGDITLKRHFKFEDGQLVYYVDSDTNVNDDILMEYLSMPSDLKMHNIVSTIQREQNSAIRDLSSNVLIIQGVAGSGKSSIALHRAAYLLYKFKGKITSNDILIVSPNEHFSEYISGVLPELEEDNVAQCEMDSIPLKVISKSAKFETREEQAEKMALGDDIAYVERAKFKASKEFAEHLKEYMDEVVKSTFYPRPFSLNKKAFSREYLMEEYNLIPDLSPSQRISRLFKNICNSFKTVLSADSKLKLRKHLAMMVKKPDVLSTYLNFYEYIGRKEYYVYLDDNTFEYSDLFPMAYVKARIDGVSFGEDVEFIFIDEMQDYSPIAYELIKIIYKCKKTLLGDVTQVANGLSHSLSEICSAFDEKELKVYELNNSYRSTYEIIDFSRQIVGQESEIIPIARHGEAVGLINSKNIPAQIAASIKYVDRNKYKTIGILCKDMKRAKEIYRSLSGEEDVSLITDSKDTSVIVSPIWLAKGLEFDYVIVVDTDDETYRTENDKNLLYVACTRAMHKLELIYSGEITRFV